MNNEVRNCIREILNEILLIEGINWELINNVFFELSDGLWKTFTFTYDQKIWCTNFIKILKNINQKKKFVLLFPRPKLDIIFCLISSDKTNKVKDEKFF